MIRLVTRQIGKRPGDAQGRATATVRVEMDIDTDQIVIEGDRATITFENIVSCTPKVPVGETLSYADAADVPPGLRVQKMPKEDGYEWYASPNGLGSIQDVIFGAVVEFNDMFEIVVLNG